jgi:hypothetical protein
MQQYDWTTSTSLEDRGRDSSQIELGRDHLWLDGAPG